MRIKKLEIFGFKSFASRQSITFGRGVTGIVGPNGCGKSNVVDALRWVMGEQNPRHLRGGNMQDIIFCGSEKKAPLGFAEVILTLENSDQDAPLEFNHFSEIQISRRLYKTGDSEYEINRQKVRLRDVSDFFLGTGVGTKAYSIIEQGRVNDIVSAKPADRRLIIEEAAGITKYKAKKLAAERRMDATRTNLNRIIDIRNEVDKRVAGLLREKEKLEKVKTLKNGIKEIDLHIASHQYLAFSARLSYIDSMSSRLNAELLESERSIASTEQVFSRVLDEYSQKHEQKRLLDNLENQHKNTLELLKKDLEYTKATQRDNLALVSRTEAQLDEIEKRNLEICEDIKRISIELDECQKLYDVVGKELLEKSTSGQTVVQKRQNIINDERSLQKKLMEDATNAARLQVQIQSLREQEIQKKLDLENASSDLSRRQEETASFSLHIEALSNEHALGISKKQDLEEKLDLVKKSIREGRDIQQAKSVDLRKHEDEKMSFSSRLKSLKEIDDSCEWSESGIPDLLASDSKRLIKGIVADAIRVKPGFEEMVEKCLAHLLDAAIIDDHDALKEFSLSLQKKKSAQTSFLVLSQSETYTNFSKPLGLMCLSELLTINHSDSAKLISILSRFFIANTLAEALRHWPAARVAQATIFSQEGEMLLPDGRAQILGQNGQGVLKRKNELVELDKKISALTVIIEQDKGLFLEREQKIVGLEYERDQLQRDLQPLNFSLVRLEESIKQKKLEREKALAEINRLKEKAAKLKTDHNFDEKLSELNQKWAQSLADHKASEDTLEQLRSEKTSIESSYESHLEAIKFIEIKKASLKEKSENLSNNLKDAQKNLHHLSAQKQMLVEQMSDKSADEIRLNENERQIEKKMGALVNELNETIRLLSGLNQECTVLAEKKLVQELELAKVQAEEKRIREQIHGQELVKSNTQNEINIICDRINERYQLKLLHQVSDFHLKPLDENFKRKEMDELKRALDRMGAVNENAAQEYDDLSARSDFLKVQVDDLNDALNQLESAIKKINKTTKMRFLEAFNCINKQFSEVFPRLFNGGKAELALLDEDDLLNCGVDIMAKPPGKNVSSIELMSGGEKALTAISLIVAIFLIKPSPFCLLDEVDAPLDEANVSRFSQLVKEMSALSQFIVITHNRKTMESADQLYGVTMEDAGMSKIVSVHVQQAFDTLKQVEKVKISSNKPTQLFLDDVIE